MTAILMTVALLAGNGIAIRNAEDPIPALIEEARAAEKNENLDEAARAYQEILRIRPHWGAVEFNLGLVYSSQKKYAEAIQLLTQVLQDDRSLVDAHLFLGVAYYHTDHYAKAVSSLKRFLELRPYDPEVHFFLAATYYSQGDYPNAALQYLEQMKVGPNRADVYYYLSKTYLALAGEALIELKRQKALPERKVALEEVFQKDLDECAQARRSPKAQLRAACTVQQGDYSKATSGLIAAQSRTPHDPRIQYEALRVYTRMAGEIFARLVTLSPDSYFVPMLRAANLQQEGKYTDADRQYELAEPLAGDDSEVFVEHGKLKDAMGQFREAIPLFQKALALDPNSVRVSSLLGEVYWLTGQPEAALPSLQKVVRANPNDAQSRMYLARALESLGRLDDAIGILREAPSDDDGRIHFMLAKYYYRQEKKEDAERASEFFRQRQQVKKNQ
jgi:tetratricopeptide (TPR) repeat protein